MRIGPRLIGVVALASAAAARAAPGETKLVVALSGCRVETVRQLLEAGVNPNAASPGGEPVQFLAAGRGGCTDADALEVAKLLDAHGARFDRAAGTRGPSLLLNLAPRRLPRTLAFLAAKRGAGDPTQALRAIATRDDLESVRALLDAGADPTEGIAKRSALMDAALAGRAESVAEMLKRVRDPRSPKVLAAYEAAMQQGNPRVLEAFTRAGLTPPPPPTPTHPACDARPLDAEEGSLLSRVGIHVETMRCQFLQSCGDLILVDCDSAADGPAYYLDRKAEKLLATCGGACMRGCTDCPPKDWHCECRR